MKRFFCVRCNSVKRVHTFPASVDPHTRTDGFMTGRCRRHDGPNAQMMRRVKNHPFHPKKSKSTPQPSAKPKKTGQSIKSQESKRNVA